MRPEALMRKVCCRVWVIVAVLGSADVASARQGTITGLTLSPSTADAGATVTATATGSTDPCGAVHIDWGDGTAITYATEYLPVTQTHVYKSGGTFQLRAQGMGNCRGEARSSIVIKGPPPPPPVEPRLSAIVLPPMEPEPRTPVEIRLEGTGECRLTLDFGDGNDQEIRGTLPVTVRHTYALPGRYRIVATPERPCAERRVANLDIRGPRERPRITGIDVETSPSGGESVRSITVVGNGHCTYTLDFGDGNSESRGTPLPDTVVHNYPREGRYTIVATARPPCSGMIRQTFLVAGRDLRGAVSRVVVQPRETRLGQAITITVEGRGTCRFEVDFDDGGARTLTERLPYRLTHRYREPGAYDIVVWGHEPCTGQGNALVRIRR
jgi:hypothetical protein